MDITKFYNKDNKELLVSNNFNESIENIKLPNSMESIFFGYKFNQPIENDRDKLNLSLSVKWPESLERIKFGINFNQPIEKVKWPDSLKTIQFGWYFTQPIEDVKWPNSLKIIGFSHYFNQPIENVKWPNSLETIKFGYKFNQPIENVKWPDLLETIYFDRGVNQPLDFLPEGLTSITIYNKNYHHYLGNLPLGIQKIYLMEDIKLHDIVPLELKDKVEFI